MSGGNALAGSIETAVFDLDPVLRGRIRLSATTAAAVYEEQVEDVITLIQETVESDAWLDNGGDVGRIAEMDGRLIVTGTPRMLRETLALLEMLAR